MCHLWASELPEQITNHASVSLLLLYFYRRLYDPKHCRFMSYLQFLTRIILHYKLTSVFTLFFSWAGRFQAVRTQTIKLSALRLGLDTMTVILRWEMKYLRPQKTACRARHTLSKCIMPKWKFAVELQIVIRGCIHKFLNTRMNRVWGKTWMKSN